MMPFHATNIENSLPDELKDYLRICGLKDSIINKCNYSTRIWHDLGIYGDVSDAFIDVLINRYGIDMDEFDPSFYFPEEFTGRNLFTRLLTTFLPFMGWAARKRKKYPAITLKMIERAIHHKRWSLEDNT